MYVKWVIYLTLPHLVSSRLELPGGRYVSVPGLHLYYLSHWRFYLWILFIAATDWSSSATLYYIWMSFWWQINSFHQLSTQLLFWVFASSGGHRPILSTQLQIHSTTILHRTHPQGSSDTLAAVTDSLPPPLWSLHLFGELVPGYEEDLECLWPKEVYIS